MASFINNFLDSPRVAEVYNLGGGRDNSISILEAFELIESISGKKMMYDYSDQNRSGDHICYISDLTKIKSHYPKWDITQNLEDTFGQIYRAWSNK